MKGIQTVKKSVALFLAAALSLSLVGVIGTSASAATTSSSPAVTLMSKDTVIKTGVKIYIVNYVKNGDTYTEVKTRYIPTDVNGKEVTPFIIEDANGGGTTYLPIRGVGKIFGVSESSISWDQTLKNVYVTTPTTSPTVTNTNKVADSSTTYTEQTVVAYSGASIYVNSSLFVPTDANGNIVNTYLIEDNSGGGTVYLPLRAMTNVFLSGVTNASNYIKWDSATRSVTIYDPASAKAAGDTEELDDDDDSDLDIDINQIIKELIEDLIKDKFPTLDKISAFFKDLKDKLGTNFDLSSIKAAILEKLGSIEDSSLLSTFKAILKEKGLTLEQLMEKFQADDSGDLIAKLNEYMNSYINGSSFSNFSNMFKDLFGSFDLSSMLTELPSIEDVIAGIMSKFPALDMGEIIANLRTMFCSGTSIDFDSIRVAIKSAMSDSDILTAIKAWLSENSLDMDDLKQIFNTTILTNIISSIREKLPTSFDTNYLASIKAAFEKLFPADTGSTTDVATALREMMQKYLGGTSGISLSELNDFFIAFKNAVKQSGISLSAPFSFELGKIFLGNTANFNIDTVAGNIAKLFAKYKININNVLEEIG
ncbi:MAG: hypothetical protein EOM14_05720 [Clostridia bacterium]|nr:hypothetical protein [Clostridia bacterium]